MENKYTAPKIILIVILVLTTMAGLFFAGCGGFFTIGFLFNGGGGYNFYIISVPFLIGGLLLLWLGIWGIRKIRRSVKQGAAPTPKKEEEQEEL